MTESNSVESNTLSEMDTLARVKRLEGAAAVVALEADSEGCGRCSEPGGCRSGLLTRFFHSSRREFLVPNEIGAREGERILIRLASGSLVRWSLTAYLLPVLSIVIGAAIGASIVGETVSRDGGAVVGSLVGLLMAACLIVARLALAPGTAPRLVRISDDLATCGREDAP